MKEIKKPDWERIDDLEREVKMLRDEIAKVWDAHNALARRSSAAILAHTRLGGAQ